MFKKSGETVSMLQKIATLIKIMIAVGMVSVLLLAFYAFWWVSHLEVPSVDNFDTRTVDQSTKIYDRTGETLLFNIHGDVRRTVVPLTEISKNMRNATIAIEDADFYQHHGIRPLRILKAAFDNAIYGTTQGGSTLTQQVVKNVYLTREKTLTRKVKEWILAIALEKKLTKDQILSVYLNEMPYGGTIYGVQEASKYYFGKNAKDLTLAEAAYLAALPQRPSYYSPHGNHKSELDKRQRLVLSKMLEYNFITEKEYRDALNETVVFNKFKEHNILAPHFVFYIRDYLIKKYGKDVVYNGGLKVTTTIDTRMQEAGEEIIKKYATMNEVKFNAENAALVAIDPKTGQILAMVGSRDYFDEKIDGKFNVATAHRQPGSTFKPIVYSTAFEQGFTPETVVFDLRTQFSANCPPNDFSMNSRCYSPVNYDGKFQGPITLRNALAQSVNIPAVKVLHMVGIKSALQKAHDLGIEGLDAGAQHYGLSLVLGGGEVTPLELTGAYSVFANDGVRNPVTGILKVEDASGNILEQYEPHPQRVLSEQAVRELNDVLSDNDARAPSYGRHSFLYFNGRDVAAKTGTTNDFRDVWVVGYTPNIAVGTWAGNNNNSPIVKKVAGFVIAPMWRAYMDKVLPLLPNESFIDPEPLPKDIKPILRGAWQEAFSKAGGAHSILYFVDPKNPQGPAPINPAQDPQYYHWEYPVQVWATGQSIPTASTTEPALPQPTKQPAIHNTTNTKTISIINPASMSTVMAGQPINIQVTSTTRLSKVEYYVNGVYIGASVKKPFSITFVPKAKPGLSTIKAVGHIESLGGAITDSVNFYIK